MKFRVICDSREKEQYRYTFPENWECSGSVVGTLKTGDYTLKNHEDDLCIERKKTVSELSINIHEDRFYRELERMKTFKWAFVICEFPLSALLEYPEGSNLPPKVKSKIKVTGPYLLKKVTEIMTTYPYVHFLFCGNQFNAYTMCVSIFKRVHESKP